MYSTCASKIWRLLPRSGGMHADARDGRRRRLRLERGRGRARRSAGAGQRSPRAALLLHCCPGSPILPAGAANGREARRRLVNGQGCAGEEGKPIATSRANESSSSSSSRPSWGQAACMQVWWCVRAIRRSFRPPQRPGKAKPDRDTYGRGPSESTHTPRTYRALHYYWV
jgi:hypothetical protein